eukprot:1685315-Alexandrium_andersonii.AAC.1
MLRSLWRLRGARRPGMIAQRLSAAAARNPLNHDLLGALGCLDFVRSGVVAAALQLVAHIRSPVPAGLLGCRARCGCSDG